MDAHEIASQQSNVTASPSLEDTIAVIPYINGRALLERLIPSMDLPGGQIVVVDQGSTDDTEALCVTYVLHRLQLGSPHSFTSASNAGIRWALDRGAQFVCLLNNDVEFTTPVLHQLVSACDSDRGIGVIAPTQVVCQSNVEVMIYRTSWDCSRPRFDHDRVCPSGNPVFLEADFCEFTCVVFPARVFADVGFLDDDFEFYYEDADFSYRLRERGYRAVYHQHAQIVHYASSTFSKVMASRKAYYVDRNTLRFRNKHVTRAVNFPVASGPTPYSWSVCRENLGSHLRKLGLLSRAAPSMQFGHPGVCSDYLYTVWETSRWPAEWGEKLREYQHIFVPCQWNRTTLQQIGCENVGVVPHGVDPDVFSPWGEAADYGTDSAFLCVLRYQHRKGLDVLLGAWAQAKARMPKARLVIFGYGIPWQRLLGSRTQRRTYGKLERHWYANDRVLLLRPKQPLTPEELASVYRGAHACVLSSRSEGFGLTAIEAMACGTLTILPAYASTAEFIHENNCFSFSGDAVPADYSDKGFHDVGTWWEPSVGELTANLLAAYDVPHCEQAEMTGNAYRFVMQHYTWRNAAYALKQHLDGIQAPGHGRSVVRSPLYALATFGRWVETKRIEQLVGSAFIHLADRVKQFGILLENKGALYAGSTARSLQSPPKASPREDDQGTR